MITMRATIKAWFERQFGPCECHGKATCRGCTEIIRRMRERGILR